MKYQQTTYLLHPMRVRACIYMKNLRAKYTITTFAITINLYLANAIRNGLASKHSWNGISTRHKHEGNN